MKLYVGNLPYNISDDQLRDMSRARGDAGEEHDAEQARRTSGDAEARIG